MIELNRIDIKSIYPGCLQKNRKLKFFQINLFDSSSLP